MSFLALKFSAIPCCLKLLAQEGFVFNPVKIQQRWYNIYKEYKVSNALCIV